MAINIGQVAIEFQSNLDQVFKQLDKIGERLDKVLTGRKPIQVKIDDKAITALDQIADKITVMSDLAEKFAKITTNFFDMLDGKLGNVQTQITKGLGKQVKDVGQDAEDGVTKVFRIITEGARRVSPLVLGSILGVTALVERLVKAGFDIRALIPGVLRSAIEGGGSLAEILKNIVTAIITLDFKGLLGFLTNISQSLLGIVATTGLIFGGMKGLTSLFLRFLGRKPESTLARFASLIAALNDGLIGLLYRTKIFVERFGLITSLLTTATVSMKLLTAQVVGFTGVITPMVGVFTTVMFAVRLFATRISAFILRLRAAAGDGRAATTLFLRAIRQMFPIMGAIADNAKPIAKLIREFAKGGFIKKVKQVQTTIMDGMRVVQMLGRQIDDLVKRMEKGMDRIVKAILGVRDVGVSTFERIGRKGARDAIDGADKVEGRFKQLGKTIGSAFSFKTVDTTSAVGKAKSTVMKIGRVLLRTTTTMAAMAAGGVFGALVFGTDAAQKTKLENFLNDANRDASIWMGGVMNTLRIKISEARQWLSYFWDWSLSQLGIISASVPVYAEQAFNSLLSVVTENMDIIGIALGASLGPLVIRGIFNIVKGIPALLKSAFDTVKPGIVRVGVYIGALISKHITEPLGLAFKRAFVAARVKIAEVFGVPVDLARSLGDTIREAAKQPGFIGALARVGRDIGEHIGDGVGLAKNAILLALVAPFSKAAAKKVMINMGAQLGRLFARSFSTAIKTVDLSIQSIKKSFQGLAAVGKWVGGTLFKGFGKLVGFARTFASGLLTMGSFASDKDQKARIDRAEEFAKNFEQRMVQTWEDVGADFKTIMGPFITWFGKTLGVVIEKPIERMARGGRVRRETAGAKEERLAGEVDRAFAAKVVQDVVTQMASRQKQISASLKAEFAKAETELAEETEFQIDITKAAEKLEAATKGMVLNLADNTKAGKKLGMMYAMLMEDLGPAAKEAKKLSADFMKLDAESKNLTKEISFLKKGTASAQVPKTIRELNAEIQATKQKIKNLQEPAEHSDKALDKLLHAEAELALLEEGRAKMIESREKDRDAKSKQAIKLQERLTSVMSEVERSFPDLKAANELYKKNILSLSGKLDETALVGEMEETLKQNNEALRQAAFAFEELEGLVPEGGMRVFRDALHDARVELVTLRDLLKTAEPTVAEFEEAQTSLKETMKAIDTSIERTGKVQPKLAEQYNAQLNRVLELNKEIDRISTAYGDNQRMLGKIRGNFERMFKVLDTNVAEVAAGNTLADKLNERLGKTIQSRNEQERVERVGRARIEGASQAVIDSINAEIDERNQELVTLKEMRAKRDALAAEIDKGERILAMETQLRQGELKVTDELIQATGLTKTQLEAVSEAFKSGELTFGAVDEQLKAMSAELNAVQKTLERQRGDINEQIAISDTEATIALTKQQQTTAAALAEKTTAVEGSTAAAKAYMAESQRAASHLRKVSEVQAGRAVEVTTKAAALSGGLATSSKDMQKTGLSLQKLLAGVLAVGKDQAAVAQAVKGVSSKIESNLRGSKIFQFSEELARTGDPFLAFQRSVATMQRDVPAKLAEMSEGIKAFYNNMRSNSRLATQAVDNFGIETLRQFSNVADAMYGLEKKLSGGLTRGIDKFGEQSQAIKDLIMKTFLQGIGEGLSGENIVKKIQEALSMKGLGKIKIRATEMKNVVKQIENSLSGIAKSKKIVATGHNTLEAIAAEMQKGVRSLEKPSANAAQTVADYFMSSMPKKGPLRRTFVAMGQFGSIIGNQMMKGTADLGTATNKFVSGASKAGISMMQELGKGIVAGGNKLKAATAGILKAAIRDQMPSSLPKYGPLRDGIIKMREFGPLVGEQMLKGVGYLKELVGRVFNEGIVGAFSTVLGSLGKVVQGVTAGISSSLNWLANTFEKVISLPGTLLMKMSSMTKGVLGLILGTIGMVVKALTGFIGFVAVLPLRLVSVFTGIVGKVIGAVTGMIQSSINELFKFIDETANKLVQLQRQAVAVDVDLEQYDRLTRAFEMLGVNASEVQQAFLTLRSTVTQVISEGGVGEMSSIFAKVGITFNDLQKMKPDEMFMRMVTALRSGTLSMRDQERLLQAMGAQFGTLRGAVMDATADISGSIIAASKIPPIGKKGIEAAEKFKASIETSKQIFERIKIIIFEELAPFLANLMSNLETDGISLVTTILEHVRAFTRIAFRSLGLIFDYVKENWIKAKDGSQKFWSDVSAVANAFFTFIGGAINTLLKHGGGLVLTWLEMIFAAIPPKIKSTLAKAGIDALAEFIKFAAKAVSFAKNFALSLGEWLWNKIKLGVAVIIESIASGLESILVEIPFIGVDEGDLTSGLQYAIDTLKEEAAETADIWGNTIDRQEKDAARIESFYGGIQKKLKAAVDEGISAENVENAIKVIGNNVDELRDVIGDLGVTSRDVWDAQAEQLRLLDPMTEGYWDQVAALEKQRDTILKNIELHKKEKVSAQELVKHLRMMQELGLVDPGAITAGQVEAQRELRKQASGMMGEINEGFKEAGAAALEGFKKDAPELVRLGQQIGSVYEQEMADMDQRLQDASAEVQKQVEIQENLGKELDKNVHKFDAILTRLVEIVSKQSEYNTKVAELGGNYDKVGQAIASMQAERSKILEATIGSEAEIGFDAAEERFKAISDIAKTIGVGDEERLNKIRHQLYLISAVMQDARKSAVKGDMFGLEVAASVLEDVEDKMAEMLKGLFGETLPESIRESLVKKAPFTAGIVENLKSIERRQFLAVREALRAILKDAASDLGFEIFDAMLPEDERLVHVFETMQQLLTGSTEEVRKRLQYAAEQLQISGAQHNLEARIEERLHALVDLAQYRKQAEQETTQEEEKQNKLLQTRIKELSGAGPDAFSFEAAGFGVKEAKDLKREMRTAEIATAEAVRKLNELERVAVLFKGRKEGEAAKLEAASVRRRLEFQLAKEGITLDSDFDFSTATAGDISAEVKETIEDAMRQVEVYPFIHSNIAAPIGAALGDTITGVIDGSANKAVDAARKAAEETGNSFNATLYRISMFAKKIFDDLTDKAIAYLVNAAESGLSALLTKVFDKTLAAAAMGLLAIATGFLSNLQGSAEIIKDTVDDAVASTEEIRGVISGTTTVAIKETEEAFRASMRGTEKRLDTIIELMRSGAPMSAGNPLGATGGTTI